MTESEDFSSGAHKPVRPLEMRDELLGAVQTRNVDEGSDGLVLLKVSQVGQLDQYSVGGEEEKPVTTFATKGAIVSRGVDGEAGFATVVLADDFLLWRQLGAGVVHAALDNVVANRLFRANRHYVHIADSSGVFFTAQAFLLGLDAQGVVECDSSLLVLPVFVLLAGARNSHKGETEQHCSESDNGPSDGDFHGVFSLQSVATSANCPWVSIRSGRSAARQSSVR